MNTSAIHYISIIFRSPVYRFLRLVPFRRYEVITSVVAPTAQAAQAWRFWRMPWGNMTGWYYPLVICYIAIENGPVEIVHLPSYNMVIFHSFLYVYQRVSAIKSH